MLNSVKICFLFCLVACAGIRSPSVIPVQTNDKRLSCKEIRVEMNEAEQYKRAAEKNKEPNIGTFFAPLGYMYTLTSAAEAIEASENRIEYLEDIYKLTGCDAPQSPPQVDMRHLQSGHTFSGGYPTPRGYQQQPPPQTSQQR